MLIYVKYAALMQWTVAQWHDDANDVRKGEDWWKMMCAPVVPLLLLKTIQLRSCLCYLTKTDKLWCSWWKGVRYTKNNDILHFNKISDEEKECVVVGTTHALPHTKTMSYGTVSETFDLLQNRRNCVFAVNNHYWWNLGVWLRTRIEISEEGSEGKTVTEDAKIVTQTFKSEANYDNGLWLYQCNCHTRCIERPSALIQGINRIQPAMTASPDVYDYYDVWKWRNRLTLGLALLEIQITWKKF